MSTVSAFRGAVLESGDRMTREEFHSLYERTPEDFHAELVGGVVYVTSPVRRAHGAEHLRIGSLLVAYEAATAGVEAGDNSTVILGDDAEPQPDLNLRILSEYGGQSSTDDEDYIVGPPELVIEIAHSSRSIDLHAKRESYAQNGVAEYLVICLAEREMRWFDLTRDIEIPSDSDGILRMRQFPGLWIDGPALFAGDLPRLLSAGQAGLTSPEHAAFVAALSQRHVKKDPS